MINISSRWRLHNPSKFISNKHWFRVYFSILLLYSYVHPINRNEHIKSFVYQLCLFVYMCNKTKKMYLCVCWCVKKKSQAQRLKLLYINVPTTTTTEFIDMFSCFVFFSSFVPLLFFLWWVAVDAFDLY